MMINRFDIAVDAYATCDVSLSAKLSGLSDRTLQRLRMTNLEVMKHLDLRCIRNATVIITAHNGANSCEARLKTRCHHLAEEVFGRRLADLHPGLPGADKIDSENREMQNVERFAWLPVLTQKTAWPAASNEQLLWF